MASYYEVFTGQNWGGASENGGRLACAACLVVGCASLALGYNVGVGLWTLFVGLLIAVWEVPLIYVLIPRCEDLRVSLVEQAFLKKPLARAALYVALSILCYTKGTLCVLAGLFLDMSALLYIFAFVNRLDDISSGLTTDDDVSEQGPLSNKFGTF